MEVMLRNMFKRCVPVVLLLLLAMAAPARSAATCGTAPVDGRYLNTLTGLHNISCVDAKRVLRRVRPNLCAKRTASRGWTIRHRGPKAALHVRLTKGNMRFDFMATQGSCV